MRTVARLTSADRRRTGRSSGSAVGISAARGYDALRQGAATAAAAMAMAASTLSIIVAPIGSEAARMRLYRRGQSHNRIARGHNHQSFHWPIAP